MSAEWMQLGTPAPTDLVDARLQAHWAMQVVGAVGDAMMEKAEDDSQATEEWQPDLQCMLGKVRAALRLADMTLLVLNEQRTAVEAELALDGKSMPDAMHWLCEQLSVDLSLRHYDMPSHPVGQGAPFELGDGAAFQELARWFHDAEIVLRPSCAGEDLLTWPHHFDVGALLVVEAGADGEGKSIGLGLSPGDGNYAEPYYYVTPFPAPDPSDLPALDGGGTWHTEGFVGAVLTGSNLVGASDQRAQAESFLKSAMAASRELLG